MKLEIKLLLKRSNLKDTPVQNQNSSSHIHVTFPGHLPVLPPPLLMVAQYLPLSLRVWIHPAPPSRPPGFDLNSAPLNKKKKESNLKKQSLITMASVIASVRSHTKINIFF